MKISAICVTAVLLGASVLLAGCSSQGAPSGTMPAGVAPLNGNGQGRCANDNIRIQPCRITFNTNNPGPTKVHVTLDGNGKGTITETDDCASAYIATVSETSNGHYTVTAGATAGKCIATFTSGSSSGDLRINNQL